MTEGQAGTPRPSPFAVLGVELDASARQVERAAQRLLAQIEVGATAALQFAHRGQRVARTAEDVRAALTVLRDPDQRLAAELDAIAPVVELSPAPRADLWAPLGAGLTRPWEETPPKTWSFG